MEADIAAEQTRVGCVNQISREIRSHSFNRYHICGHKSVLVHLRLKMSSNPNPKNIHIYVQDHKVYYYYYRVGEH